MSSHERDDRVDPTVLDAWQIEPLGDDFADRVVTKAFALESEEKLSSDPSREPSTRRRRLAIAGVVALAAGLALVLVARPAKLRERTASPRSEPSWTAMSLASAKTIEIAGRARLEARPGARLAWRVSEEGEAQVRQDFGRVRYAVEPGGPFVIDTPAGHVRVVGTEFTVEVMEMKQAHKRWSSVTAVAAVGLATWVFVHDGEVEVANAEGTVGVREHEQILMTEDAPPQVLASAAAVEPDLHAKRRRARDEAARRIRQRQIEHPRERRDDADEDELSRKGEAEGSEADYLRPEQLPAFEADYIRDVIRDQLVPSARACYNEILLVEDPEYAGSIVLNFTIVTDEDIGGVVDEVKLGEETDIDDARFLECMQNAMYETLFPPPEEGGEIKVSYPMNFLPG